MKRKGSETIEDSSLIKSLRRSISNFENSIKSDNEGSSRKSIENLKAMDRLQSRLATFTVLKWKGKLHDLSPLKCAQYGWICRDSDFLQCDECKKFLCVSIPPLSKISIQVYNSCIRNCIRQLTEAHDIACSWRFAEASNFSFSYDILERFKELSSYEVKAPLVEPSKLDISVEQFEADKQDAILLAIFGWKIK